MQALSLAIVGAAHPNKRGPTRRFGISLCRPGDPLELRREPKNEFDEYAIAVFGPQDIQIGYVRSERAVLIAPMLDRGREVAIIFQAETESGCWARVAFDGELPVLPPIDEMEETSTEGVDDDPGFWPDEAAEE